MNFPQPIQERIIYYQKRFIHYHLKKTIPPSKDKVMTSLILDRFHQTG